MTTIISSVNIHHLTQLPIWGDENFLRSSLIKFQIYNTVFITIASTPYIKSPGLIYLMTESLYILIVAF